MPSFNPLAFDIVARLAGLDPTKVVLFSVAPPPESLNVLNLSRPFARALFYLPRELWSSINTTRENNQII